MAVYKSIVEAVTDAVYHYQYKTIDQIAWYVEWWTGIHNANRREIEKITHKVTTQYKQQ